MTSSFLFNEGLWAELRQRVQEASSASAAIAYLGSGASTLLPLRRGHRLVVDMSLRSVRAGATDPKEVRKLLKRGVQVFTRGSLHAKFVIADTVLIAGSANMSANARRRLDEAAVLTDDPAAVRRAISTFEALCTEPVRAEYLAQCLSEYRPPRQEGARTKPSGRRPVAAKAWLIGGLRYLDLPEAEQAVADRIRVKARKLLDFENTEVDDVHYPSRPGYFGAIRKGDWAIVCTRSLRGVDVYPPACVLGHESYARGQGKRRHLLLLERPSGAKSVGWGLVRAKVRSEIPAMNQSAPRTLALAEDAKADALLRLWDAKGTFRASRAKKRKP